MACKLFKSPDRNRVVGLCLALVVFFFRCSINNYAQIKHKSPSKLQEEYDAAQQFQASGDLTQAGVQYRLFVSNALGELATMRGQAGEYEQSASLFDDALSLSPHSPDLEISYAETALSANDLLHAQLLAKNVLGEPSIDANTTAKAFLILGRVSLKLNKDIDAKRQLEKAVALNPNFENGYTLAVACLDLEDQKCAAQLFSEMTDSFGDTAIMHMYFGRAYGESDFQEQAVEEFKKALQKDDRLPGVHYSLAAAYLATGEDSKLSEAEEELRKEISISPEDSQAFAQLGRIAMSQHQYIEARKDLKRAISINPKSPDAYEYLGQLYVETKEPEKAESALRKSIQLTNNSKENQFQVRKAHYLLGRVLMQLGEKQKGEKELQISSDLMKQRLVQDKSALDDYYGENSVEGGVPAALLNSQNVSAADATDRMKKADNAAVVFSKQMGPALADSYNNLGIIAAESKEFSSALVFFQKAYEWNPTLSGLDYNWGKAAFLGSQFQEAIEPLTRSLQSQPQNTGIRSALGISLFMTKDYAGAIKVIEPMASQVDAVPQLAYSYAVSEVKAGDYQQGILRLKALEHTNGNIADIHQALGESLASHGDWKRAKTELQTAISINSSDADAYYDLGELNLDHNNLTEAATNLEAAAKLEPLNPLIHNALAMVYQRESRLKDAAREREEYKQLQSNGPILSGP